VNIQILSPLTSILSHRGERRYFVGFFFRKLIQLLSTPFTLSLSPGGEGKGEGEIDG
jgi:hypothetical protein